MNLKQALMELGNKLVTQEGYLPGHPKPEARHYQFDSLDALLTFTEFLNESPEARDFLAQQGIEWPVVEGS